MKRYIYLLIIGLTFLILYNLLPIRETLTGSAPMPQPLIVELTRSAEWQAADAQNSANNAQRLAWQKDNAQQQLNQQNADNKRRQQNEDDQEAQCKADAARRAQVGKHTRLHVHVGLEPTLGARPGRSLGGW